MEIRQLRYFASTVRLGSVGAAAAEHFVTQPAVSLQIKKLEEELGQKLLARRGRQLLPTEAGAALAARAEEIIRLLSALEADLSGMKQLASGTLRLGNTDAASVYVLPDVYRAFHNKYAGVRVEIMVAETRRLLDALRARTIEIAIATLPIAERGLVVEAIYQEELVPVARPDHPLASRRGATLADLAGQDLITYPAGAVTRGMIDRVFAANGLALRPRMEISSPEAMKRLAQAGLGVSILPRPVVATELGRKVLKAIPVAGVRFQREIGMVFRADDTLSPAARVFRDMIDQRFRRDQRSRAGRGDLAE
jgi:DNA-binding transcriptional LysR family regulator